MARFHALLLAAVLGALLGTMLRPGVLEIAIVAVVAALVWPHVARIRRLRKSSTV